MRAIVTGARGTVGGALAKHLELCDYDVIPWDRAHTPVDDYWRMHDFVKESAADALFHLAVPSKPTGRTDEDYLVSQHWPSELAWICRMLGVTFVFASSVMVYTDKAKGPFVPHSPTDATEGYGGGKVQAERRVLHQNHDARIVRLGWQIGEAPGSNNMIDWMAKQQAEYGKVEASTRFFPACSFLQDTAAALVRAVDAGPGTYLVDSNTGRWSLAEIASALNEAHGKKYQVVPVEGFEQDQRMLDERLKVAPLSKRLAGLPTRG